MDAKRRRLLSESPSRSRESSAGRSSSASRDVADAVALDLASLPSVDLLRGDDLPAIELAVTNLKKQLISKEAISSFINIGGRLPSLIQLLNRASGVALPESHWSSILRTLVSLLGNVCNFSMRACLELSLPKIRFPIIATRMLEMRACNATKASVLRLTGNLCQKKESARSIASCGSLVDKVAGMLDDDNEQIRTYAFRVIRLLVERRMHRAIVLSNGVFHLGKLLKSVHQDEKRSAPVITTLTELTKYSTKDTGKQLSTSESTPLLLALFVQPSSPQPVRDLLLLLAAASTDIRDRLGEADVIRLLMKEREKKTDSISEKQICALLAAFTQDAWGRAALRETGALDVLLARLADATESTSEKAAILVSFRHLVHDTTSMAYLCRSRAFIDCLIKDVGEYVDCYGEECEPISLRDRDTSHRPWSPILVDPELRRERKKEMEKRAMDALSSASTSCATYTPPWLQQQQHQQQHQQQNQQYFSPPPPYYTQWSLSPPSFSPPSLSLSPPSSSHQSPEHGLMSSPSRSLPYSSSERAESTVEEDKSSVVEDETVTERKQMKQVIDNELWLVGWQANEDANLPYLMREDLVTCMLTLLRMVSPHSIRLGRPLKRMATSRHSIEGLLSMHFHSRIFHSLCTPPCRLARFARRCRRCEQDAEFGSEILRDFSSSVDSDFGHGLLLQRLASDERTVRVAAAVAKISLIRNRFRLSRRPSGERSSALQVLMEEIRRVLLDQDYDTESTKSLYEGGPPLLVLIIGSLSTLVDPSKMKDAFELDTVWKVPSALKCKVKPRPREEEEGEQPSCSRAPKQEDDVVTFEDSQGHFIGDVVIEDLREASEYFNGMFSSDMVESRERRRKFVINEVEENCTLDELKVFVHCLAGCEPSVCLARRVEAPRVCIALVRLADKYLCGTVLEWALGAHGPTRRLLDGASLHLFLPLALHICTHHRVVEACLVTLLRFSSECQLSQATAALAGEPGLVEPFVDKLTRFIQANASFVV